MYLENYCKKYNPNSHYIGQGCDLTLFQDSADLTVAAELEGIAGPRIGFVGALNSDRLDIVMLLQIAKARPQWNIVLVGPADDRFASSELNDLKNVFFIGSVAENRLPAFIKGFDVCLNPQLLNEITIGNYPRKIDEYLALGKPVVATKTEAMVTFNVYVYLAEGKDEYLSLIEKALDEDSVELYESRKLFASTHTWANSVSKLYAAIKDTQ